MKKKTKFKMAIMQAEALERCLADLGIYLAGTPTEIADQLRRIEAQKENIDK